MEPPHPRQFPLLPPPQTGLPDSNLHEEEGLQIDLSYFRPTCRLPSSITDTTQQGLQTTSNWHSQLLQQTPEPQLADPRPTNILTWPPLPRNSHSCRPSYRWHEQAPPQMEDRPPTLPVGPKPRRHQQCSQFLPCKYPNILISYLITNSRPAVLDLTFFNQD